MKVMKHYHSLYFKEYIDGCALNGGGSEEVDELAKNGATLNRNRKLVQMIID